ncbi:melanocortin receptor 5-like [Narcine bancroftii]|uniref:melanocortin receptor 5-like n=1 Tax=Narcine bancroftii TaxID=1343680 RepID=UPI00383214FF
MVGFGIPLRSNQTLSPNPCSAISLVLLNGTEAALETSGQTNLSATKECSQIKIPTEVYLILAGISLAENLLVVLAVIKNRNLHIPMYFFICSLAASDFLLSLSNAWEAVTMSLANHNKGLFTNTTLYKLDSAFDSLTCISFLASIFNLAAITMDRYITIFHALRYHHIMTGRRVVSAIAGIWVFCTFSGITMIVYNKSHGIVSFFVALFLVTLILILSLYLYMFLLAQMHAKRIRILPGHKLHQKVNFKGALTLTILLGVFITCWAPLSLHLTLYWFCPLDPYCTCFMSLFQIDLIFIICHSVIDPLIYAFRDPVLCRTFKKMFCSLHRRNYFRPSARFLNV